MRVRISANPPLPSVKAWFPLTRSTQTIAAFKSTLCTSIPALRDFSPRSLHLSIDGFELLDTSELDILKDDDLICIDVLDTPAHEPIQRPDASRKRKRSLSLSSSSSSESESSASTESDAEATSTELESNADSDATPPRVTPFVQQAVAPKAHVKTVPSAPPATFVPPGYGKRQTRARNLRRRLKRMHERNAPYEDGPVSGANAVVQRENEQVPDTNEDGHAMSGLMSLSLRNKNKAKNFKALVNKPLPPKIIFAEQEGQAATSTATSRVTPRLVPPSSRASLPPNMFVTSVDVEADFRRTKRKEDVQIDYGDEPEELIAGNDVLEPEMDVDGLESIAEQGWDTLPKLTREKQVERGIIVGSKGLGINPETYTPEQVLTVGVVTWRGEGGVEVRPLRAVSFSGPVDGEAVRYTWDEIEHGEWKVIPSQ